MDISLDQSSECEENLAVCARQQHINPAKSSASAAGPSNTNGNANCVSAYIIDMVERACKGCHCAIKGVACTIVVRMGHLD